MILHIHICLLIRLWALISSKEDWVALNLCILFGLQFLFLTICISVRIVPVCLISYYECWLVLIWVAACELWWNGWYSISLICIIFVRYNFSTICIQPGMIVPLSSLLLFFSFLSFCIGCGYLELFLNSSNVFCFLFDIFFWFYFGFVLCFPFLVRFVLF